VAILGVDNDELFCELAHPPLSSIAYSTENIGYEAAHLLEKLMHGKKVPPANLFPPIGVVTRRSSDILAINDPDLSSALRFIRSNPSKHISVKNLLDQVHVSRRTLESKFRRILGRSPLDEIVRVRILEAQQLLTQTKLSMVEIARLSGFSNAERLSVVFKKKTGSAPQSYRKKFAALT